MRSKSINRTNDTVVSHRRESIISLINLEHPSSSHPELPRCALVTNLPRHPRELRTPTPLTSPGATPSEQPPGPPGPPPPTSGGSSRIRRGAGVGDPRPAPPSKVAGSGSEELSQPDRRRHWGPAASPPAPPRAPSPSFAAPLKAGRRRSAALPEGLRGERGAEPAVSQGRRPSGRAGGGGDVRSARRAGARPRSPASAAPRPETRPGARAEPAGCGAAEGLGGRRARAAAAPRPRRAGRDPANFGGRARAGAVGASGAARSRRVGGAVRGGRRWLGARRGRGLGPACPPGHPPGWARGPCPERGAHSFPHPGELGAGAGSARGHSRRRPGLGRRCGGDCPLPAREALGDAVSGPSPAGQPTCAFRLPSRAAARSTRDPAPGPAGGSGPVHPEARRLGQSFMTRGSGWKRPKCCVL